MVVPTLRRLALLLMWLAIPTAPAGAGPGTEPGAIDGAPRDVDPGASRCARLPSSRTSRLSDRYHLGRHRADARPAAGRARRHPGPAGWRRPARGSVRRHALAPRHG